LLSIGWNFRARSLVLITFSNRSRLFSYQLEKYLVSLRFWCILCNFTCLYFLFYIFLLIYNYNILLEQKSACLILGQNFPLAFFRLCFDQDFNILKWIWIVIDAECSLFKFKFETSWFFKCQKFEIRDI
jgi:hypothetical protein